MALTPSTMVPLGTPAPDFDLLDTASGGRVKRDDFDGQPLLVMFICNHCPFVVHLKADLARFGEAYGDRLGIVAISSNDVRSHPQDGPKFMAQDHARFGYPFPYLFDESQTVARSFSARCTPDFFLFDADQRLAYRGQLDGSRPSNALPVSGEDLRGAIDALLAGAPIPAPQQPSLGCGIKWKPGNEPS